MLTGTTLILITYIATRCGILHGGRIGNGGLNEATDRDALCITALLTGAG